MPSTTQQSSKNFKQSLSRSSTLDTRAYYEEPYQGQLPVLQSQIWGDSSLIPVAGANLVTALALAPNAYYNDSSSGTNILQKLDNIVTSVVNGTQGVSYYSASLINSIPATFDIALSYRPRLYRNVGGATKGAEIAFGNGDWMIDNATGVLRFHEPAANVAAIVGSNPPIVSCWVYTGTIGISIPATPATVVGTATTTYSSSGVFQSAVGVVPGMTLTEVVTKLSDRLYMIMPAAPAAITTISLSLNATLRSGRAAGSAPTGTVITNIVTTAPTTAVTALFNVSQGDTISTLIKNSASAASVANSIIVPASGVLTSSGTLITIDNTDQYNGLYRQYSCVVGPGALSFPGSNTNQYTYQVQRYSNPSTTVSGSVGFYVGTSITPTVTSAILNSITLSGGSVTYASGVALLPSVSIASVQVIGVVASEFYHATSCVRLTGPAGSASSVSVLPNSGTTGNGASAVMDTSITVNSSTFTSGTFSAYTISYTGTNSSAYTVQLPASAGTAQFYLDVPSVNVGESTFRVTSGVGQFPTFGATATTFGAAFNSATSLISANNEELQIRNALVTFPPAVNYVPYVMPSGITNVNYSSITGGTYSSMRWITFPFNAARRAISGGNADGILNASSMTVTFASPVNFGSANIIPNFAMYVIVLDPSTNARVTNWLDCNAGFSGFGSPGASADGDAALDLGRSTPTARVVTFGQTIRSGNVYVRVGINSSAAITFSNISIVQT